MKKILNIETWMLLVIMLLTACSDRSDGSSEDTEDCFLNIYVYAPGRPMLTRADVGEIAHREAVESEVHTLQIWVFKHSDGDLVGYLNATPNFLNETDGQELFRMKVEKEFADNPENVDVYVVANAESVELTLGENTERDDLDAAKIGTAYFGTSTLVSSVPPTGLPMSGVEKDQPIYGSYPTLRVGTQDAMTTVQLTRAVSKLRFVLCRIASEDDKELVSIDRIQLDGGMIPTESYLMPGTYTYSSDPVASTDYETNPIVYVNTDNKLLKADIPTVVNPMKYAYETQAAQDYEDMINGAIAGTYKANENDEELKELGLTYLRESDKQLTGTIQYSVQPKGNTDETKVDHTPSTTFSIAAPGDFYRNRSWIIYVFYMDAKIHVLTVTDMGVKSWTSDNINDDKSVYNW
ncbi:MAG: hypothetical protein J6T00_02645 [Bacteroidaceae bacterium]|nr:hypothetical protein [Bacteroidaceae bacterium]